MPACEILLLGDARLHEVCAPVEPGELPEMRAVVQDLHDTLMAFRARYGAGRAIAAPQIGVMKRLFYMHVGEPVAFLNPVLSDLSEETMTLWDDCMCFPDLFVRVQRHRRCRITFRDLDWDERTLDLRDDLSELIQHEYDHLDGILATSRALDARSFRLRAEREAPTADGRPQKAARQG